MIRDAIGVDFDKCVTSGEKSRCINGIAERDVGEEGFISWASLKTCGWHMSKRMLVNIEPRPTFAHADALVLDAAEKTAAICRCAFTICPQKRLFRFSH